MFSKVKVGDSVLCDGERCKVTELTKTQLVVCGVAYWIKNGKRVWAEGEIELAPVTYDDIIAEIMTELNRAVTKFPDWPTDPIHAAAVVGEESGELTRAALQVTYEPEKATVEDMRIEAIQTAVTAIRFLAGMDDYKIEAA